MLRIAVCDDEKLCRRALEQELHDYLRERKNLAAQVSVFSSGWEVLAAAEGRPFFDLYLLDVVMPSVGGIELGLKLRELGAESLIIYLTSSAEFAVDAYRTRAFHYLLKPLERETLHVALDMAFPS